MMSIQQMPDNYKIIILYYTVLYYIILRYIILYYIILYYIVLYYIILYYTVLYYIILYYIIQIRKYKIKHLTWRPHSPSCPVASDLTPTGEANSFSGSQNNHTVWSPMVHYHFHRSDTCPYPVPNLSSLQRPILFL